MIHTENNAPLRNDEAFASLGYLNTHQFGACPLIQLGVGLFSQVPNDYICIRYVWELSEKCYLIGEMDLEVKE